MQKLIYPDICLICGTFFRSDYNFDYCIINNLSFEDIFSDILCDECRKKYSLSGNSICYRCGNSFGGLSGDEFSICEKCLNSGSLPERTRSHFIFKDSIIDIVHMFKYNAKVNLDVKISYFILKTYLELYKGDTLPDYIFPVPMHKSKMKKRGYNQTYLICRKILKLAEINCVPFPVLKKDVLVKKKDTASQTGLDADKRKKNLENAFVIKYPSIVEGKRILLIDDVFTTGSTLNECAKVLMENNAGSVDAITFARAL